MGYGAPCSRRDSHAWPAPMWAKAGQLAGPRGEITFLTFPTAGARVRAQTPEPKAEGLGWTWSDRIEQGDPRAKTAWGKRLY